MGYAHGIRAGHAAGHLREPAIAIVEALYSGESDWWAVEGPEGPLASPREAYDHLGRLWHCRDIVPSWVRETVHWLSGLEDRPVWTYGQLSRALRPWLIDQGMLSEHTLTR